MSRSDRSVRPSRLAFFGSVSGKLVSLVGLVALSGVACGLALGYPVDRLNLQVSTAQQLDHVALQGTFDLESALVAQADLPSGWAPAEQSFSLFSLFGPAGEFCGISVDQTARLGDPLERAFLGPQSQVVLLSEVAQFRRVQDAHTYLRDVTKSLGSCRTFVRKVGDSPSKVAVRDDLGESPVTDYVARTLEALDSGAVQVVAMFQAGSAVVALQYIGPTKAPAGLFDRVQAQILARIAPEQFSKTTKIAGLREVPPQPTTTTTTTIVPVTTTTELIPQITTTTTRRRTTRTATTARPPATPPPATTPPATVPAPTAPATTPAGGN